MAAESGFGSCRAKPDHLFAHLDRIAQALLVTLTRQKLGADGSLGAVGASVREDATGSAHGVAGARPHAFVRMTFEP